MKTKVDKKLLGGLFCIVISLFIALGNLVKIENIHTYRLTLTSDGCTYAQSIDLPVVKNSGQCSVEARFQPNIISGGALYLDDDKTIAVTSTMLLAIGYCQIRHRASANHGATRQMEMGICVAMRGDRGGRYNFHLLENEEAMPPSIN